MKYKLLVKAEAIQDMTEAFDWYESEKTGLGLEFLNEVEEYYNRITQSPQRYTVYRNQHVAVMHRFPFKIVYEIERDIIVIYAIYHDKRNPEKLMERE